MAEFISPGVYSIERDLSSYVTDLSSTIVGMVGTAPKGPSNTPVLITSPRDFFDIFGDLDPKHYLGYAALSYLKQGRQLWVNRVAASDAVHGKTAFPVPASYAPYQGEWVLSAQTASDLTLLVSDFSTITDPAKKVIALPTSTTVPGFDFTDATQAVSANGKIGSDLASFVSTSTTSLVKGGQFGVTLGPGSGTTSVITDLSAGTLSSNVTMKVSRSAFSATNSPATAFATGSVMLTVPGSFTPPSPGTALMVIGKSSVATTNTPIRLVYGTVGDPVALKNDLDSSVSLTKLTALETLVTAVASTTYDIIWPLYDPTVAGNNAKSLDLLESILKALLYVVNLGSAPSQTNLALFYPACRALISTGVYGVGSIDGSGASRGFKSVDDVKDALSNTTAVRLFSMIAGALGTFKYSAQTPAPVSPLLVVDQVISGKFTTSLYRPTWVMSASGSGFVPTYLKITSLGEADSSNIAVTLTIDSSNLSSTGEQQYTLKVYERSTASTVSSSSVKFTDFVISEQYSGTLEAIKSGVFNNSRKIALKIDYTTEDTLSYTTGVVTPGAETDGLSPSFVFLGADAGPGVVQGLVLGSVIGGYVKNVSDLLLGGSEGSEITADDIIGDPLAQDSGLYVFANPEQIDINVMVAPGWSADPGVAKAMTEICIARGDSMAIIDAPFGLTVQGVIEYRDNILNLNSSYAALYYPWVKITDSVNKKDIFIPPSGPVVGQYAFNDFTTDVFFAPAGRTRGQITDALATERVLTLGDRDALALAQVNPIHTESGFGIYIKGQRTLQSQPSALDRVNVRRLLLKLRKVIATASKAFEFEPADNVTAYRLKQLADTVLADYLNKGGIRSYTIDVGPNVNTPLVLENNELRMEISLVPTKTAEVIIEAYNILPQGAGITINQQ